MLAIAIALSPPYGAQTFVEFVEEVVEQQYGARAGGLVEWLDRLGGWVVGRPGMYEAKGEVVGGPELLCR